MGSVPCIQNALTWVGRSERQVDRFAEYPQNKTTELLEIFSSRYTMGARWTLTSFIHYPWRYLGCIPACKYTYCVWTHGWPGNWVEHTNTHAATTCSKSIHEDTYFLNQNILGHGSLWCVARMWLHHKPLLRDAFSRETMIANTKCANIVRCDCLPLSRLSEHEHHHSDAGSSDASKIYYPSPHQTLNWQQYEMSMVPCKYFPSCRNMFM